MGSIIVVGGGPAGMIAAGRAASLGAHVTLLEKNRRTGRKLLITGGGRCNVTNDISDRHVLVSRYGDRARGLHSPFSRFPPQAMRDLLASHGVATKVENEGRVFPVTDSAASVRTVLEQFMNEGGVRVRTGATVASIELGAPGPGATAAEPPSGRRSPPATAESHIAAVRLSSGEVMQADALILATGGVSRPETGSTGDGFRFLESLGHTVRLPKPSVVPVAVRDEWPTRLQGVAITDVKLVALLDGTRQFDATGKLLFTHFGLSGPLVLNLSQKINELAQGGPVELQIDLFPTTDGGELERTLQAAFDREPGRKLRNTLATVVPPRLAGTVLDLAQVEPELRCHSIPRTDRRALAAALKGLSMTFASLLGEDRAVVSSGGLDPREIDFRTMATVRYPNLFVAGDLIDVDRQSGGYSLQLCWATGWVAGEGAAEAVSA